MFKWFTLGVSLILVAGCSDELSDIDPNQPFITDVSHHAVVIGETIEFFGGQFASESVESTRLRFNGTFLTRGGDEVPVDLWIRPGVNREAGDDGREVLTWRRVGPFANPFTGGSEIGRFTGYVTVVSELTDGGTATSERRPYELDIEPSIVIESLHPIDAECSAPAARILAGLAYEMQVKTSGFVATKFTYEINEIRAEPGVSTIVHDYEGQVTDTDRLGDQEAIIFNPIDDDTQFYVAGIRIIAENDEGERIETALPISVHRPIEVRYGGAYELAQVYEPEPVSGCQQGSLGGSVSYSERYTETRQQSVRMTVSRNFNESSSAAETQSLNEGISVGESTSRSLGSSDWEGSTTQDSYGVSYDQSEQNTMSTSTTDGESWTWSRNEGESNEDYESRMNMLYGEGKWSGSVSATGEGSVPGFAKASGTVSTTTGVKAGASTAGTTGNRSRVSVDEGHSMTSSSSTTKDFGSVVAESNGSTIGGSYTLSASHSRSESETEARNRSRTWNLGSGTSSSETVSEGMSNSESQTWVSSSSLSVGQTLSGRLPPGKVGIFYRQTSRYIRRAEIRAYDQCGLANHMGELQFNEWVWAAELAIGNDCEAEPPVSRLPTAQCHIEPCQ